MWVVGRPQLQLNRENITRKEIERATDCTPTKKVFIRLPAIAQLHQDEPWERVVVLSRVSARQLLRWVHLFNTRGIDGLIPRASSGRARKLAVERFAQEVRRYLIVDNVSRHKVKRLNWHSFTPKYLPPSSPDLNPIERL